MLVKQMQEPFVPERYPNEAKRELLERIQALMPSAITPEETHTTREVMSLMEQLRASVSQTAQRV